MSRSIHTTRRTLKVLAKKAKDDPKAKEALAEVFEEKRRKRRIKRSVRQERDPIIIKGALTPPEAIPIEIELENQPGVFQAVTQNDLLAVLNALPSAAREGIAGLRLALGKSYQEEVVISESDSDHLCDPLTGRPGYLLFPGAWCGRVLGMFSNRTGLITLFACVVRESECLLPGSAWRIYLKLHALKTFVHEVAHHHDNAARIRRGRWLADRKANNENYAESMEDLWSRTVVCPYLERAYPQEVESLLRWIGEQGGIRLSLEQLASNPRLSPRLKRSPALAFERWLCEYSPNATQIETQVDLAREIHGAELYSETLEILNRVLASDPFHLDALIEKAHTLADLERFSDALEILDRVQLDHSNHFQAWALRCRILQQQKQWEALLEASSQWLSRTKYEPTNEWRILAYQTVALRNLGRIDEMNAVIEKADRLPRQENALFKIFSKQKE